MVAKRIIPCLDVKDGRTVKGVNFVGLRDVGTGHGADNNSLGIHIHRHGADSMRKSIQVILGIVFNGTEALDIGSILLGFLGNAGHIANGFHRVLTGCGLTGEHNGRGAIINRIGHVVDLSTGGTGVIDHGFQHFGSGNNTLAQHAALESELFLNGGQLDEGNFNAQVTTGDHDTGANGANLLHIVNTGTIFDLGDDLDILAAIVVQQLADIQHIFLARNKGCSHIVYILLDAEEDIFLVLFAEVRAGHDLVGEGHALTIGHFAANGAAAMGIAAFQFYSNSRR